MTSNSSVEQSVVTTPTSTPELAKAPDTKPAKSAKANKKNGGVWPKNLKDSGRPGPKGNDLEFSGRIEKINMKETAPGKHQAGFSVTGKGGASRAYLIEAGEASGGMAMTQLLLAAFAARRKVRITTAIADNGSPRIVEIEARK